MRTLNLFLIFAIVSLAIGQATRSGEQTATFSPQKAAAAAASSRNGEPADIVNTYRVDFSPPYSTVPKIAIALLAFDLDYANAGVSVELVTVQRDHFTYTITVPGNAVYRYVRIGWISTTSDRVNFGYYKKENPEAANVGGYTVSGHVDFDHHLDGPFNAVAMISGFKFATNSAAKIEPEINALASGSVGLDIWVRKNNVPTYVNILVIHYETGAFASATHQTALNGVLYNGSGQRTAVSRRYVAKKKYAPFSAISYFDFVGKRRYYLDYDVTQQNTTTQTAFVGEFSTAGNAKVHQAYGKIFYTK